MATIIAGHFDDVRQLEEALWQLVMQGFSPADYATYHLSPTERRDLYAIGTVAANDEGRNGAAPANRAPGGAAGLALAGTGASGNLGVLTGSPARVEALQFGKVIADGPSVPPAGPMLAINVDRPGSEGAAVAILGRTRARRVYRTQGEWSEGNWRDFDPREPLLTLLRRDP